MPTCKKWNISDPKEKRKQQTKLYRETYPTEVRQSYYPYGGRGVTVCDRWIGPDGYKNFASDMGERPSPKHTLDRKETNGNYEPSNCTWSTPEKQQRNRRVNHLVTINGETKCIAEWAEQAGLGFKTLQKRITNQWPESELLRPSDQKYRNKGNTKKVVAV